jgi:hypothetical protein
VSPPADGCEHLRAAVANLTALCREYEATIAQLRGRLAAAETACASIPPPAPTPSHCDECGAEVAGLVCVECAAPTARYLPAAAGPAANGSPQRSQRTAASPGSGAAPLTLHRPAHRPRGCVPGFRARAWAAALAGGG